MKQESPKPASRAFISYELADKLGEHMLSEMLKQDTAWSAEYDEGEHLLVPPDSDGSPLAVTLPLYAAINAVFGEIVDTAPVLGDENVHVKAVLDTLAHLSGHTSEPFFLDPRVSSKLMSPLLTAATVLDRLERRGAVSPDIEEIVRQRDTALHACQAAATSIRRFPGSVHDRAMAKLDKALKGRTEDYQDPDVVQLEARVKLLEALAHPAKCPITGLSFFMEIDGEPTYGGPFDSFTIPKLDDDKHFICRQFDHDEGNWKDWSVDTGLVLAQEGDLADPDEAAPAGKTTEQGEVHPIERLWRAVDLPEHFLGNVGANHKLYALHAAILAEEGSGGLLKVVGEAVREANGSGIWRTCSGCRESEDGHDVGFYPYSQAFGCKLGSGCFECGGIGAIWDTTDWSDAADKILNNQAEILSSPIRSAADEARNAFLRDVDANDQIGALNVALDAAFALALKGGAEFHMDPLAALIKRSAMLGIMLGQGEQGQGEVIRRLDLGAMELALLYGVDPKSTIFGQAAALIRDLIEPWHPGETTPIDRAILVFGKPTDIDGLKFTGPGVHTAYWDAIDGRFCIKGATWLGPFIDPLFWREEPPAAALTDRGALEAKARQASQHQSASQGEGTAATFADTRALASQASKGGEVVDPKNLAATDDERLCTERAMIQWRASLKRPDLDEEARVAGAIQACLRQAFAQAVLAQPPAEVARVTDAMVEQVKALEVACNQARLALEGMVSVQSAIDMLDMRPLGVSETLSSLELQP